MPIGIFFNRATGEISHQMSGQLNALLVNQDEQTGVFIQPGEGESPIDTETHYMVNGYPVPRPVISVEAVSGQGWTFESVPPEGAVATVKSQFIDGDFVLGAQAVSLAVPEVAQVTITAPWPYQDIIVELSGAPQPAAEGAQIIPPDLDRMRAHFLTAVAARGDELSDAMLGNPGDHTRARWKLKRSIRDRYLAGTNSAADNAAMAEAVRYSGLTVQQELDLIGAKVAFEDWVVMRADGIRQEAERRLNAATTPEEALAVIGWAEAESAGAVSEAQAKLAA